MLKKINLYSIKWHTILIVMMSSVLMLGTSSIVTYTSVSSIMMQNGIEELDRQSDLLADYLAPSLQFYDTQSSMQIIKQALNPNSIGLVCVYDKEGIIFTKAFNGDIPDLCAKHRAEIDYLDSENVYQKIHVIKDALSEFQGFLFVAAKLTLVDNTLNQLRNNHIAIFLLLMPVAVLFAIFVHPLLSQRIINLSEFTKKVTENRDYSLRFNSQKTDEVGLLARSLNNLLETIESQQSELMKQKIYAEKANKTKTEFLANMSHELRTPMHAIMNFTELLIHKYDSYEKEKAIKYLNSISVSANRLLMLLNDLLDLSKLQSNKMSYNFEPVDAAELFKSCESELSSLMSKKSIKIEYKAKGSAKNILADEHRLSQVFINLLSNAVKFSPNQSVIQFTTDSKHDDFFEICLIDEGPGVDPSELDSIFDEFIQSKHTKTGAGGTGLGLSICKRIINDHAGTICASNNAPGGLKITIRMPYEHKHQRSSG